MRTIGTVLALAGSLSYTACLMVWVLVFSGSRRAKSLLPAARLLVLPAALIGTVGSLLAQTGILIAVSLTAIAAVNLWMMCRYKPSPRKE